MKTRNFVMIIAPQFLLSENGDGFASKGKSVVSGKADSGQSRSGIAIGCGVGCPTATAKKIGPTNISHFSRKKTRDDIEGDDVNCGQRGIPTQRQGKDCSRSTRTRCRGVRFWVYVTQNVQTKR